MRWDAKTIVAVTGLASVLLGGVELRMSVSRLDDKLTRVEERLQRVEREVSPPRVAALDPGE
ncbi:MAG TPA: hypothetical protein VGK73_16065 [Polyangiaceae bacterium]